MLSDIIRPVADVTKDSGLYILVYGASGVGKTTLAGTTPDPSKTLVISAERGTLSIQDSGVMVAEVASLDEVRKIHHALKTEKHGFNWVVLDSITDIAGVVLKEELEKNKDGRKAYGELNTSINALLRAFRDLPLNVLVIAAEQSVEDEGRIMKRPKTPGKKLGEELPYLFDEVFYLKAERADDGTIKRALLTANDGKRECKDRSGKLATWEPPNISELAQKILTTN